MILTFTPNPSIDATLTVESLTLGEVIRVSSSSREPGGKGINVSNAAVKAGATTCALAPAHDNDPFTALARAADIPLRTVSVDGKVRTNTTITDANGVTTKLNEAGATLSAETLSKLETELADASAPADAVVLAGSLPPGAPRDWYPTLVQKVRTANPNALIAVDTSDEPLIALGEKVESGAPDIIKPNGLELGQLAGVNGHELEERAADGDLEQVVTVARTLVERGIKEVLVTLGGAGACLITAEGAWAATPPPAQVRSTVGAGDSSLAGYVLARIEGLEYPGALRRAVAYGTAAASNPGTEIPGPGDIDTDRTDVRAL